MNRLHYFCTIAQSGSLARASEFLGLSPAALSKAMKIFEEEIGLELFRPSGRGIVITPEGERLAHRGRDLLKEINELPQLARGFHQSTSQLKVGTFEVFSTYLMGDIFQELSEDIDLVLHELGPGKIEEALLESRIDLGLTYVPVPHPELDHLQIGKVKMGVYGLKKNFESVPLAELPFVVPVEPLIGAPTKAQGLDGWKPSFGQRCVRHKVTLMESALELCRRGLAVAYLPGAVVEIHNRYLLSSYRLEEIYLPLKGERTSPVYFIKRRAQEESLLMKKVAKVIRHHL